MTLKEKMQFATKKLSKLEFGANTIVDNIMFHVTFFI